VETILKILIVTQWFDPEPTFKGLVFAQALQAQGHQVQVLTGFPNYPNGKVYEGYRIKYFDRQIMDGVEVCRVPLYPSHDGSAIRRAWNYISFAASSCLFGVFAARKPDVIYAYHPPLTVGMSAALIGFFRRTPVVYDIQDMWPDTLQATGMLNNPTALSWIGRICQWVYRRAAAIVVLSHGFKRLLIERGVPEQKITTIYNWCDAEALAYPQRLHTPPEMHKKFNVVFAGTMGKAQALDTLIDAAILLQDQQPTVQFVCVGGGMEVERLKQRASSLHNVVFLPRMPMDEVGHVLHSADVLLVHLKDDPLFEITVPSKTQAYMAVGKPMIMAVRGDAADLVRQAGCGVAIEPENPTQLAQAIEHYLALTPEQRHAIGLNGQSFYQEQLSLEIGVERFLQVFNTVITS
jgi:colanic acid biosynthesis glycosyl transferase WcaI